MDAGRVTTFGVVTPTLNGAKYFDQTLRSIWGQQSDGIKVDHVVRDGGSTDGTVEIAHRYPSRVVVAKDGGMYDAINHGMAMVQGEVIGYINADDEIAPEAFARIARAFAEHPDAGWVCGRVEFTDGGGDVLGRMTPVRLSLRAFAGIGWSCIPQQTVWVRRSFYDRVGPFDAANYRNCGDYDWYARALRLQHPLILPETLGRFRIHGEQLSFDPEPMERESRMVQERNGGRGVGSYLVGKLLSLRLNARNPRWLVAKKTGKIKFTA